MLRKRNRGETTGTEVCLQENMETYCGGNFLKSPKLMLMKSSNNGGYGVSRGLFFSPSKASSGGTGLHTIEISEKMLVVAEIMGCSV